MLYRNTNSHAKFQYLPGDAGIAANVTTINFPVAQLFHLCILGWHDTDGDLRRLLKFGP